MQIEEGWNGSEPILNPFWSKTPEWVFFIENTRFKIYNVTKLISSR